MVENRGKRRGHDSRKIHKDPACSDLSELEPVQKYPKCQHRQRTKEYRSATNHLWRIQRFALDEPDIETHDHRRSPKKHERGIQRRAIRTVRQFTQNSQHANTQHGEDRE